MGLGAPEIIVILVIVLIVFGAGRLPDVGAALPRAFKDFRAGMAGELPDPAPAPSRANSPVASVDKKSSPGRAATAGKRRSAHRFRGLGMLLIGIALILFYLDTQVFQLGFPLQAASGFFALVGVVLYLI